MSEDKLASDHEMWLFKSYADQQDLDAVTRVLERGTWWAKGPEIDSFENQVANVTDNKYGIAFNSGTSALFANLLAHGIQSGEVIVPSFTFSATANSVLAAGATPVFADIERDSLGLSANSVQEAISSETTAVMPIHFAGDVATEIDAIQEICEDNDLTLLEDACHSLGATMDGTPVGSFGSGAAFSFCFNKLITTGEGGMVVTDSSEIANKLEDIRSHGASHDNPTVRYRHNLRLASMNAALGISQMEKMDWIIEQRRSMAEYLNNKLAEAVEDKILPYPPNNRNRVYLYYNLRMPDKQLADDLANHLESVDIPTRITYNPVHLTNFYKNSFGWEKGDLPITEALSGRILTLPFHLDLDTPELDYIANQVIEFFNE